jgi:lactobin A/cerein 7B family class IIb bacteriocin
MSLTQTARLKNEIVELDMTEVDQVSGGIAPLAYAAFAVGMHLLVVADVAYRKSRSRS